MYCVYLFNNICKIKKNNKNLIFKKTSKRNKKPKFKRKKYKSKLSKILLASIIIFFSAFLTFVIVGKFKSNDNYIYFNRKPKIVAISYSNELYQRQLELNKKSAIEVGEVDEHYSYGPDDIDPVFREKNKDILSRKRGNGYWLWKAYFINKTIIEKLKYGDYLIYTDAAILFMNSSHLLINFLKDHKASMWMNKMKFIEKLYTKRDAFILMNVDTPYYYDTRQYMAGIQIYRKTKYTIKFIQEWLHYCQDARIITDDPNTMGKENYGGFRDNRHDQTVLSLLIKKYGEANFGSPNMTIHELNTLKPVTMPNILCMYRRTEFIDYEDLRQKCKKFIEEQEHEIK